MSYSITVSEDGSYIILTVSGEYHRRLAMQYNLETHALGKELGIDRFLLDMTESRNVESVTSKYVFAYEDMQNAPEINRRARVALLVNPDDHSHDFIVTVTRNSGLDVTLFTDRQLAIQHLISHLDKRSKPDLGSG
jgi:hypothetical protein